jgi:response regulator of citrate/malate metabolism
MSLPVIVLIDDNPDEAMILERAIAHLPLPSVLMTALSVLDGLALVQRQASDVRVVLLDVHMPPPQPDG